MPGGQGSPSFALRYPCPILRAYENSRALHALDRDVSSLFQNQHPCFEGVKHAVFVFRGRYKNIAAVKPVARLLIELDKR